MGFLNALKKIFNAPNESFKQPEPSIQRGQTMVVIEMYSTPMCPYCIRAKSLLKEKGVAFKDINVMEFPDQRQVMQERSGRRTVPQIFLDGQSIGGCDELFGLERTGELDKILFP